MYSNIFLYNSKVWLYMSRCSVRSINGLHYVWQSLASYNKIHDLIDQTRRSWGNSESKCGEGWFGISCCRDIRKFDLCIDDDSLYESVKSQSDQTEYIKQNNIEGLSIQ